MGCLIIGRIESIFAFFFAIFSTIELFDETYLWIGLPLAFMLPGAHFNVAIFYGAMIDGIRGAFLAGMSLYVPCCLGLIGLLPEWPFYRDREGVRRLYDGLACATTGLAIAMVPLPISRSF